MDGVASNLGAVVDEQYRRKGLERAGKDDISLVDVMRLIAREALTGAPPPDCARQVIDLWRPWIQSKVGQDPQDLDHLIGNQDAFAKASRPLIAYLDTEIGEEGIATQTVVSGQRASVCVVTDGLPNITNTKHT